jgi:hypothetical protein
MLADELDYVVGVDTHLDEHVLVVLAAPAGALVAQQAVSANGGGYRAALQFAEQYAAGSQLVDAKFLMLVDHTSGGMLGVTLFDSEGAMRKADEAMNAGPGNAGSRAAPQAVAHPARCSLRRLRRARRDPWTVGRTAVVPPRTEPSTPARPAALLSRCSR